jgi:SLOG cluster3 family
MASEKLKSIFLSASIPFKERHQKYFGTADIIAIRDAAIALATVALPYHRLVWGGHPSITPIVYYVMERMGLNIQKHLTLYQSLFFEKDFPPDNNRFENIVFTENRGNLNDSLFLMRGRIMKESQFSAGVFIGGMDGVEIEFKLFTNTHPRAIVLPIASTGAASKIVFDEYLTENRKNSRLLTDYGYMSLFQDLLMDKI